MGRRSAVDASPHKAEIVHLLMDAQWSSLTVSKYLSLKYGESIAASSLRTWRGRQIKRLQAKGELPEHWQSPDDEDNGSKARIKRIMSGVDEIPDVVAKRLQLARLQEERIKIDSENELNIGKLFNSQSREIELLNKIYSDVKADLQDMGVLPTKESTPAVQVNAYAQAAALNGQGAAESVSATPVAEALEGVPADVLSQAGRTLVLLRNHADDVIEGETE